MAPLDVSLRPSLARRAAALGIDVALILLTALLVQAALRLALGDAFVEGLDSGPAYYRWAVATVSLPAWAYFLVLETAGGATVGKRVLGMRVRDAQLDVAGWGRVFRRTAVKMLPYELVQIGYLLPVPLHDAPEEGFRWVLFLGMALTLLYVGVTVRSGARQGPHDRAAGTVVVRLP